MNPFSMLTTLVLAWALSYSGSTTAASIYKQSLSQKSNRYASEGVFMGGKAGQSQALAKVRRTNSTKVGIERIILDLYDDTGKKLPTVGYFHVSADPKNSRIVIQLNQLRQATVTEQSLRTLFAKSPLVSSVDFTVDPEDSTGTLVLKLKEKVKTEVFELNGKKNQTARLVLDLKKLDQPQMGVRKNADAKAKKKTKSKAL